MILATAASIVAGFDVVEFLAVYAAVYTAGAVYLAIAAYRGPVRAASAVASPHWRAAEPAAAR